MKIDYHLHPDYSLDAEGKVEEYCRRAIDLGLEAICITTHFDNNPSRPQDRKARYQGQLVPIDDSQWLTAYVDEVLAAQRDFAKWGLFVGLGVEYDYFPGCHADAKNLADSFPFDYFMGSIHSIRDIQFHMGHEVGGLFDNMTAEELCREYYGLLFDGVNSGLFSAIGHIDGYRKHGEKYFGAALLDIHTGFARPVLEAMATKEVAMEINLAAAFNYETNRQMVYGIGPILAEARDVGLTMITLGSDSHHPNHMGSSGTIAARELVREELRAVGFDRIYGFKQRQPFAVAL